ncbi:unnamed protein product [Cuscuta epithymum]|uniref:Scarecrow-like protein 14 n=1 Tax=Cuscuta epithymum TaxID=186058 RepID=A0AAV0G8Q3_9ASTE|nr:unnamed protein product [Cuscuta epithymum]CAH9144138.1 unnamed protein product [Cuscuta epithymum]
MVMDHWEFPDSSANELELENEIILSTLQQSTDIPDTHKDAHSVTHAPPALDLQDDHYSSPALRYISQMLLEDSDIEENNNLSKFYDPVSLRAAENSFYDALYQTPSSHNEEPLFVNYKSGSPDRTFRSSSDYRIRESTSYEERSNGSLDNFNSIMGNEKGSVRTATLDANIRSDTESDLQLKRDKEKEIIFSPSRNQLVLSIEKSHSAYFSKGKKHHHPGEVRIEEERSSKQYAFHQEEEVELSEVFDKALLFTNNIDCPSGIKMGFQQNGQGYGKGHSLKQPQTCEGVDIGSLLTSCAQSIADVEHTIAKEKLKKIRQHSSPTGDANQRLGHAFANALEARLDGTGAQLYAALASNKITASGMIKAFHTHNLSLPFFRTSIILGNAMIYEVALKSKSLHVIDFGILYGFQWPMLIQNLSQRPGGPPKLRITGIELPQPGFRPEEMVKETGCRLAKYCERFGVPFEYNAITRKNWETIKVQDLKLVSGDLVAINCLFRFENLFDEAMVVADTPDSPKIAVTNLIRKINPHIYVQSVLSGAHTSPFFLTRFREALFYYSACFDMCDAVLPRNDLHRLSFEESRACEIMNIIACEGIQRLQRTETYKQWQSCNTRAGLKPMPIRPELVKELKEMVRAEYHRVFVCRRWSLVTARVEG